MQCIGIVPGKYKLGGRGARKGKDRRCLRSARDNSSWCRSHEPAKRAWVYLQRPCEYEISGCPTCGNADPDWSEFAKHCWCPVCKLDYLPASNGVFDGPIPVQSSALMGIRFDRVIIATGQVEVFVSTGKADGGWIPDVLPNDGAHEEMGGEL